MSGLRLSRPLQLAAQLALLCAGVPWPTKVASQPIDTLALQLANRIGVLQFCATRGFAASGDIDNAQAVLANDPQKPSAEQLAEAKANGQQGRILAGETYIDMADLTAQSDYDVKQTCAGIAASAQVAVQTHGQHLPRRKP
jgi:hypothetical protein